jgi:hypothetical protein
VTKALRRGERADAAEEIVADILAQTRVPA